jgi:cytochrome P450
MAMVLTVSSVLTQPQQLQLVFKDSHEHFKAENNNSGYLMSELLGQCVGLISREHWRPLRTIMEVPFQHHKMTTHVEMVLRHTTQHFSSLQESGNLRLGYIHPTSDLKMLPFWIVAEIFYGPCDLKMRAELEQLSQMREQIWKSMIQGGLVRWSWSKYLPTKVNRTLREFQQRWRSFNQYAYQRALRDNPNLPIVTMMDSVRSENVSLEQIHQTIDEALFANLDVTTGGTSWNVVFLAAHPGVQKRLRAEAMAATDIRAYLLSTSTFLSACISESARLKPLAAFSVPQSAPVDRIVGGFLIPARTNFVVDTYALNIKNEFWGPDRQQYRPDRFLEHRPTDLRYQFWRFGFGPRQCMGRYVADLAIRAMMTHLILHYELDWFGGSIEDNSKWARDLESWITLPDMLVNCKAT